MVKETVSVKGLSLCILVIWFFSVLNNTKVIQN